MSHSRRRIGWFWWALQVRGKCSKLGGDGIDLPVDRDRPVLETLVNRGLELGNAARLQFGEALDDGRNGHLELALDLAN